MTPTTITDNNTPITEQDVATRTGPGKGSCGGTCGGKGNCGSNADTSCGCGCANSMCGARSSCGTILSALLIALGLGVSGWMISCGLHSFSAANRVIDTRGFAEREVKADLAIWNIFYVATGNDLTEVQTKIESDSAKIRDFLTQSGLKADEIIELPTSMTDLLSRDYRSEGADQGRYIVNAGLRVRSSSVELVQSLSGMKIGALIKSGVTLRDNQTPPVYVFTKLKDIKPEMVAEATEDAKRAATEFARDSGAKLAGMKSATQGVFQFLARDQAQGVDESYEINKTARVVTTVRYLLED